MYLLSGIFAWRICCYYDRSYVFVLFTGKETNVFLHENYGVKYLKPVSGTVVVETRIEPVNEKCFYAHGTMTKDSIEVAKSKRVFVNPTKNID